MGPANSAAWPAARVGGSYRWAWSPPLNAMVCDGLAVQWKLLLSTCARGDADSSDVIALSAYFLRKQGFRFLVPFVKNRKEVCHNQLHPLAWRCVEKLKMYFLKSALKYPKHLLQAFFPTRMNLQLAENSRELKKRTKALLTPDDHHFARIALIQPHGFWEQIQPQLSQVSEFSFRAAIILYVSRVYGVKLGC